MSRPVSIKDYMSRDVVTVSPQTDIMETVRLLVARDVTAMPVVDDRGDLVGMISERDCLQMLLQASYYGEKGGKVGDFMSPGVASVHADDSLLDVAKLFVDKPYKRYPVMGNNHLVGIISRRDLMQALLRLWG
ncbi:MAG: CBS domain-containing protein [Gemmatimonadales bacterium]|jgi:CBS domain-containing protein